MLKFKLCWLIRCMLKRVTFSTRLSRTVFFVKTRNTFFWPEVTFQWKPVCGSMLQQCLIFFYKMQLNYSRLILFQPHLTQEPGSSCFTAFVAFRTLLPLTADGTKKMQKHKSSFPSSRWLVISTDFRISVRPHPDSKRNWRQRFSSRCAFRRVASRQRARPALDLCSSSHTTFVSRRRGMAAQSTPRPAATTTFDSEAAFSLIADDMTTTRDRWSTSPDHRLTQRCSSRRSNLHFCASSLNFGCFFAHEHSALFSLRFRVRLQLLGMSIFAPQIYNQGASRVLFTF